MAGPSKQTSPPVKKAAASPAPASKAKGTRTIRTPAQRVAKLEADLAAAKAAAGAKDTKRASVLSEKRTKLVSKVDAISKEIAVIDNELALLTGSGSVEAPVSSD